MRLQPKADWLGLAWPDVQFPELECSRLDDSEFAACEQPDRLLMGASWTFHVDEPAFLVRQAIFESLYFPYELPPCLSDEPLALSTDNIEHRRLGDVWRVANGVLLWPRINLSAYTDLQNRRDVYIKDPQSGRFFARLTIEENLIRFATRKR